jgi:hypothetical protein
MSDNIHCQFIVDIVLSCPLDGWLKKYYDGDLEIAWTSSSGGVENGVSEEEIQRRSDLVEQFLEEIDDHIHHPYIDSKVGDITFEFIPVNMEDIRIYQQGDEYFLDYTHFYDMFVSPAKSILDPSQRDYTIDILCGVANNELVPHDCRGELVSFRCSSFSYRNEEGGDFYTDL